MNIFFLHGDPKTCAEFHVDRHVNKMCFEYAQLLSSAHPSDFTGGYPFPKSVPNHPCAIWVRASRAHYAQLWSMLDALCVEYCYRYGKPHYIERTGILQALFNIPNAIESTDWSDPPLCVPDEYKLAGNTVVSYRNYYNLGKRTDKAGRNMHKWTKRPTPRFITPTHPSWIY